MAASERPNKAGNNEKQRIFIEESRVIGWLERDALKLLQHLFLQHIDTRSEGSSGARAQRATDSSEPRIDLHSDTKERRASR